MVTNALMPNAGRISTAGYNRPINYINSGHEKVRRHRRTAWATVVRDERLSPISAVPVFAQTSPVCHDLYSPRKRDPSIGAGLKIRGGGNKAIMVLMAAETAVRAMRAGSDKPAQSLSLGGKFREPPGLQR
jgi:hypothetical protein